MLFYEGGAIVHIWSKGRIPFDPAVMNGVLLLYGSYTFWATSSVLLGASNRHGAMTWLFAGGTGLGLTLAFVLAQRLGLPGLVYGIAAADIAVASVWIPRIACRSIGQSYSEFLLEVLGRGAVASAPVVLAVDAAARLLSSEPALFRILALAAVAGICTLATLLTVWLNSGERRQIGSLARRLLGR